MVTDRPTKPRPASSCPCARTARPSALPDDEAVERGNGRPTAAIVRDVVRERVRSEAAESEAERIVSEFIDRPGVALGDGPVEGQNPWPQAAPMYEYEVEAADDDPAAERAIGQAFEARRGPVQ